ncbi:MAG: response regulator [bacterium]|nr:response regulator [bacterium]
MARILLVEDDGEVRETYRKVLERAGYEVVTATNGQEGLDAFSQEPADVVVTDILMPEKDGVEFIRELRRAVPDVRIIAVTGFRGRYNRLPAARYLGAQYTLSKPFPMEELLDAIRHLLQPGTQIEGDRDAES